MLSLVDIVLNHTADNSQWIVDQPDATYNLENTPHLYSAWLLDEAIQDFSDEFIEGKVLGELKSSIKSEQDLQQVMKAITKRVFNPLKIQEYFMCKPTDIIQKQIKPFFSDPKFNDALIAQYKLVFD
jgi:glycogen debranching enzyme